jgi:hypothetical protein
MRSTSKTLFRITSLPKPEEAAPEPSSPSGTCSDSEPASDSEAGTDSDVYSPPSVRSGGSPDRTAFAPLFASKLPEDLGSIRALTVCGAPQGPLIAAEIHYQPELNALATLQLKGQMIKNLGACYLACAPHIESLVAFYLANNKIHGYGISALMTSHHQFTNVRHMDLSGNHLGAVGCHSISHVHDPQDVPLPKLETLNLSRTGIRDRGGEFLSVGNAWPSLIELNLTGNDIGEAILQRIRDNPSFPQLEYVYSSSHPDPTALVEIQPVTATPADPQSVVMEFTDALV